VYTGVTKCEACAGATLFRHSGENPRPVIPVKTGNQDDYELQNDLDPGVHRGDDIYVPRATYHEPRTTIHQSGGVMPCRIANLTSAGTSLTPSFFISRLR